MVGACAPAGRAQHPPLVLVRTVGESMLPTLRDGDLVVVDTCRRTPRAGDIALVRVFDRDVVHRIISTRPLRQTGDGRSAVTRLRPSDVLGTVVVLQSGGVRRDLTTGRARLRGRVRATALLADASRVAARRRIRSITLRAAARAGSCTRGKST